MYSLSATVFLHGSNEAAEFGLATAEPSESYVMKLALPRGLHLLWSRP